MLCHHSYSVVKSGFRYLDSFLFLIVNMDVRENRQDKNVYVLMDCLSLCGYAPLNHTVCTVV